MYHGLLKKWSLETDSVSVTKSYLKTLFVNYDNLMLEAPCGCWADFGAKDVFAFMMHLQVPICAAMKSIFTVFLLFSWLPGKTGAISSLFHVPDLVLYCLDHA